MGNLTSSQFSWLPYLDLNLHLLCITNSCKPFLTSAADKYPGTGGPAAMQIHRWRNWKTALMPYNITNDRLLRGTLSSVIKGEKALEANRYKEITVSPGSSLGFTYIPEAKNHKSSVSVHFFLAIMSLASYSSSCFFQTLSGSSSLLL